MYLYGYNKINNPKARNVISALCDTDFTYDIVSNTFKKSGISIKIANLIEELKAIALNERSYLLSEEEIYNLVKSANECDEPDVAAIVEYLDLCCIEFFNHFRSITELEDEGFYAINRVIQLECGEYAQLSAMHRLHGNYSIYIYDENGILKFQPIATTIKNHNEMEQFLENHFCLVKSANFNVYRCAAYGDCTNNGITSHYNVVPCIGENIVGDTIVTNLNNLLIVRSVVYGREKEYIASPVKGTGKHFTFGGNYISPANGTVFGFKHLIKVFDRHE